MTKERQRKAGDDQGHQGRANKNSLTNQIGQLLSKLNKNNTCNQFFKLGEESRRQNARQRLLQSKLSSIHHMSPGASERASADDRSPKKSLSELANSPCKQKDNASLTKQCSENSKAQRVVTSRQSGQQDHSVNQVMLQVPAANNDDFDELACKENIFELASIRDYNESLFSPKSPNKDELNQSELLSSQSPLMHVDIASEHSQKYGKIRHSVESYYLYSPSKHDEVSQKLQDGLPGFSKNLSLYKTNMREKSRLDHSMTLQNYLTKSLAESTKEVIAIEVESFDTSFVTIFKRMEVEIDALGDLKITSIASILANKGFDLWEQILTYYSQQQQAFVVAAALPISRERAIIPRSDLENPNHLTIKFLKACDFAEYFPPSADTVKSELETQFKNCGNLGALQAERSEKDATFGAKTPTNNSPNPKEDARVDQPYPVANDNKPPYGMENLQGPTATMIQADFLTNPATEQIPRKQDLNVLTSPIHQPDAQEEIDHKEMVFEKEQQQPAKDLKPLDVEEPHTMSPAKLLKQEDKQEDKVDFSVMGHRDITILQVVQRQALWRKYCRGFTLVNDVKYKKKPQEAAAHLGVPYKELCYDIVMVRRAARFDFDFGRHANENIGFLEAIVKHKAHEQKEQDKSPPLQEIQNQPQPQPMEELKNEPPKRDMLNESILTKLESLASKKYHQDYYHKSRKQMQQFEKYEGQEQEQLPRMAATAPPQKQAVKQRLHQRKRVRRAPMRHLDVQDFD